MFSLNDSMVIARLVILTCWIALGACTETEVILPEGSETGTPPPVTAEAPDADNDGFTDEEEASLGTSPIMADTDGDGFNDKEEITNGGTHPLIADVPSFSIDVTGSPTIDIRFQLVRNLYIRTNNAGHVLGRHVVPYRHQVIANPVPFRGGEPSPFCKLLETKCTKSAIGWANAALNPALPDRRTIFVPRFPDSEDFRHEQITTRELLLRHRKPASP